MVNIEVGATFRFHCNQCPGNTGYFETPRASVVHLDEVAQAVVFYATCPEGHQHPVDPEFAMFSQEVRLATESLRSRIRT